MNGRVYDPRLGRFLSADPFVQFPSHTQSFNRYAYVLNNPLRYTDPSGHFVFSFGAAIWIAAKGAVEWYIAAAVFGAAGFADALLQGASINDALTAGVFSGVSGAAFSAIAANPGWFGGDRFLQAAAFGTVGGITSTLRGGKFGHGFLAAGLGAAVSATGLTDGLDAFGRTMTAAILGGTVSEITGGKFANGAAYAAFASIVREVGHKVVGQSGINQKSSAPLAERQAAARKEVAALSTDGALDTNRVFTGDSALDDAAIEVLSAVHPISEKYNVEIGGRLVANGGGVSYGAPIVGNETSLIINPRGALGAYHTHYGGVATSLFSNRYTLQSGSSGDAGYVAKNKIPLYMSNQPGAEININVCSLGSARCRGDFDPRLNGSNRGITGTRVN